MTKQRRLRSFAKPLPPILALAGSPTHHVPFAVRARRFVRWVFAAEPFPSKGQEPEAANRRRSFLAWLFSPDPAPVATGSDDASGRSAAAWFWKPEPLPRESTGSGKHNPSFFAWFWRPEPLSRASSGSGKHNPSFLAWLFTREAGPSHPTPPRRDSKETQHGSE